MARPDTSNERRAGIIAATIELLARDGLAATTTRKMAEAAEMNQATLLYYFESKDQLLLAVLQEMMRQTQEIARKAVQAQRGLRETVARSLLAFWEQVEAAPELQIMQYELTLYALRNPDSAWLAKQQYSGYCAVVEQILRDAFIIAGQTSKIPYDALARFIVGGLDGMILQFISDHDRTRARQDLAHLTAATLALALGSSE